MNGGIGLLRIRAFLKCWPHHLHQIGLHQIGTGNHIEKRAAHLPGWFATQHL